MMGLLSLIGRVFRTLCDFTPSRRWCIFAHTSARQMATHAISSLAFRLPLHAFSWSASTLIFLLTHLCTALTFCYDSTRSSDDCARDFFGTSEHFVHDQLHNGPAPGHSLTAVEVSPDSPASPPVRSCCLGAPSSNRASARSRRRARKRAALLHSTSILKTQLRRSSRRLGRRRRRKRRHMYHGVHARGHAHRIMPSFSSVSPILTPMCPTPLVSESPPCKLLARAFLNGHVGSQPRYSCVVDTGATHHMTGDKSLFDGWVKSASVPVGGIGAGTTATAYGRGSIDVNGHTLPLHGLLYVPTMQYTLLSVRALCRQGFTASFTDHDFSLFKSSSGKAIVQCGSTDGLYLLRGACTRRDGAIFEEDVQEGGPLGFVSKSPTLGFSQRALPAFGRQHEN